MLTWLRYAVLIALPMAVPALAHAQSDTERAAQLNEEGKVLWHEKNDLGAAAEKFRQATEVYPDPRYYFNLCYSLHQLQRYREALDACEGVATSGGDEKQRKKAQVVIDDIRKRIPDDPPEGTTGTSDPNTSPDPGTGTDPNTGTSTDPTTGYGPDTGVPPGPIPGLYQPAEIPDDYKWSLGGELGLVSSSIGNPDVVSGSGVQLKLFADFMLLPSHSIGAQGYLSLTSLKEAVDGVGERIDLADVGGAVYKHIPLKGFYVTPLVGIHIALFQPERYSAAAFASYGIHGEASFSLPIGPDRKHVISVTPGLSIYFPAASGDSGEILFYGLNKTSAAFTFNVGYTLRFTTPFGQSSLITLE